MQLSADVYLQLIDALKSEPRRGREQRGGVRVGVGASLTIQLASETEKRKPLRVRLRDLSVDGIGIVAPRRLDTGECFVLSLTRNGQFDLRLICEVRYCETVADRVYHIGARLVSDNAADERFGVGKKAKRIRAAMFS